MNLGEQPDNELLLSQHQKKINANVDLKKSYFDDDIFKLPESEKYKFFNFF